jgi:hypothetical protein
MLLAPKCRFNGAFECPLMECCRNMQERNPVNPVLSCTVRSPPFWDIPCPAPMRALDPFAGLQNRAHERAASATRD